MSQSSQGIIPVLSYSISKSLSETEEYQCSAVVHVMSKFAVLNQPMAIPAFILICRQFSLHVSLWCVFLTLVRICGCTVLNLQKNWGFQLLWAGDIERAVNQGNNVSTIDIHKLQGVCPLPIQKVRDSCPLRNTQNS